MSVTKADLERAKKIEPVDLSEWFDGGQSTAHVCSIRGKLLLDLAASTEGEEDSLAAERAATYAWVIHCFCDDAGELLLADDEDARTWLGERPFKMLQVILRHVFWPSPAMSFLMPDKARSRRWSRWTFPSYSL